jgi:hypothetical protein
METVFIREHQQHRGRLASGFYTVIGLTARQTCELERKLKAELETKIKRAGQSRKEAARVVETLNPS